MTNQQVMQQINWSSAPTSVKICLQHTDTVACAEIRPIYFYRITFFLALSSLSPGAAVNVATKTRINF